MTTAIEPCHDDRCQRTAGHEGLHYARDEGIEDEWGDVVNLDVLVEDVLGYPHASSPK